MSPGESLSRVQMFVLNLPRPTLQHPMHDDAGRIGVVDFWWQGVVGEFDGRSKYGVPRGGRAPGGGGGPLAREEARGPVAAPGRRRALDLARRGAPRAHGAGPRARGLRPSPVPGWFDLGAGPLTESVVGPRPPAGAMGRRVLAAGAMRSRASTSGADAVTRDGSRGDNAAGRAPTRAGPTRPQRGFCPQRTRATRDASEAFNGLRRRAAR